MKTRHWSIRSKIIALVAVPLSAFLALWIFATTLTAGPALHLLNTQMMVEKIGDPGQVLIGELQRERRLSVEFLSAAPGALAATALTQQRAATDRAATQFRGLAGDPDLRDELDAPLRARLDQLFSDLAALPGQRVYINRRQLDPVGAQGLFNEMINTAFEMFNATAGFGDPVLDREINGLTMLGRGREYLSRVDALLAGAIVAGRFTDVSRGQMVQDIGTARYLLADGVSELPPASRAEYEELTRSTTQIRLANLLDTLVTLSRSGVASPVTGDSWSDTYTAGTQELRQFELDSIKGLEESATPLAVKVLVRLGLAALLGLIALIVSVAISLKVGRSIVGRLRRLRGEAIEMASERLPTVVRRLQRGEAVDVEVETPPLEYGRDEIGQLGHAFNDVQRTAVQSAVEEANVRRGINEVFLNIARRSQTLLHRQLALLDKMERRETEPQELEDLYRVDHLATRMRRHAEDLVILAGAAPGRGWRNPVPVIDVVRGAISEVEDYKRIDIHSVATASVLGRAVGDVIHLVAELLENAASFSPPHTRVQVGGQVLPNGYAVEIEDRGLGMTPEAIEEANRRLLEPPDFDPADSARLGLFVVAQLSNRHGIRVSLRASAYGGVTAIVFLPGDLVSAGPGAPPAAGTTPGGDKGRERPLVGSGSDDPTRHSLASLQWQGAEQLREVTVPGRRSPNGGPGEASNGDLGEALRALNGDRNGRLNGGLDNGIAQIPQQRTDPALNGGQHRAPTAAGGPAPSEVAQELSAEGLVQRRRIRRPTLERPETASTPAPSSPAAPIVPGPVPGVRSVPRNSELPTVPSGPAAPGPLPVAQPAPRDHVPNKFDSGFVAAGLEGSPEETLRIPIGPSPEAAPSTEDGLPKRVRQASLAPQLRRKAGEPTPEPAPTFRSPEQVRSIMSALQSGTTRGRIDASRYAPVQREINGKGRSATEDRSNGDQPGDVGRRDGASFADAATVSFPVVKATDRDEAAPGDADDPGGNDVTRPEKDA